MRVVLLDNRDSFVYNLVDQFAVLGAGIEVYRNTVPAARVLGALEPTRAEAGRGERPDLCLSPGPGHPRTSGCLMELVAAALAGSVPTLGICLGFQAIVEACGGAVSRVGPVHGRSVRVEVTAAGRADSAFAALAGGPLDVARYHSLGTRELPQALTCLARCHYPRHSRRQQAAVLGRTLAHGIHVHGLRQRDIKGFQPLQVRRFFLLERCGQLGARLRGQGRDAPVRLKARIAHRAFSSQKAPAKARVRPGR